MLFPKRIDDSLRGRVKDMLAAFDAGALLSAITLALTLPDICGARMCPREKNSSKRYVAWFNRYVAANYRSSSEGNEYYFDGSDCYQLRCVFLHEGSNAPHREKEKTVYHIAQFRIFENSPEVATDHIGRQWSSDDPNAIFAQVDLDLARFLHSIESGVEHFLKDHPDANEYCPLTGPEIVYYSPVLDFRSISSS